MNRWIAVFGRPKSILTDRGTCFTGGLLGAVRAALKIKGIHTTAYHPEGDGIVERSNRTLLSGFSKLTGENKRQWYKYAGVLAYAHNSSYHTELMDTPFRLMFGREPDLVLHPEPFGVDPPTKSVDEYAFRMTQAMDTVIADRREQLKKKQDLLDQDNALINADIFAPGDLVLLKRPFCPDTKNYKLHKPFVGPYEVVTRKDNTGYIVKLPGDTQPKLVHVNTLKKYVART